MGFSDCDVNLIRYMHFERKVQSQCNTCLFGGLSIQQNLVIYHSKYKCLIKKSHHIRFTYLVIYAKLVHGSKLKQYKETI